jgi:hypothetical protein
MTTARFSRRVFLKATGLSGAFLPLVGTDPVQAAPAGVPGRVLIIGWTNGYVMSDWRPRGSGRDFELNETLKPLAPWKSKLLVVDGVGQKVHYEGNARALGWKKDQWWGGHDACPAVLTGVPLSMYEENRMRSGGDSIDQFIARELAKKTALPFSSLVVGPYADASAWGTFSYSGASAGITAESNPWTLHRRLFEGRTLSGGQINTALLLRRSVLDYVKGSLSTFTQRLGTEDRARVESHLQAVRDTERELASAAERPTTCASPDPGATFDVRREIANYPKALKLLNELVAAALRCDLTRVVAMPWTDAGGDNLVFSWLGSEFTGAGDEYPRRQYHDITHNQGKSPDHRRRKIRVEQWFFEQVAAIVKRLADTPEGTGSMLDNTLVVVTNTMGSNHDSKVQPFTLIGNINGHFDTGKYLKTPYDAHNRVLVAVANAMGVDGSQWGAKAYASELPGLRRT